MRQFPPSRIVCLTEETVETLYLLGEQGRIVGVSGYAVRPPQVRREKPRISAFTSADIPKILALVPDLVLTFSDLQAEIASDLIHEGVAVHAFNQRDVAGILAMIRTVGALVGAFDKAEMLAQNYEARLSQVVAMARGRPRPTVYFEEWDDPLISGIGWVSEHIEIAGGNDVFRICESKSRRRIVSFRQVMLSLRLQDSSLLLGVGRRSFRTKYGNVPAGRQSPCPQRPNRRDQIGAYPAARARSTDRWPGRDPSRACRLHRSIVAQWREGLVPGDRARSSG